MEIALTVGQGEQVLDELLVTDTAYHVILLFLLFSLPQLVKHLLVLFLDPHYQVIIELFLFLVFLLYLPVLPIDLFLDYLILFLMIRVFE